MPNKDLGKYPFLIFRIALFSLILSMPWSRAVTSISTALLFISALGELIINKPRINFPYSFYCLVLYILFCLFDLYRAESFDEWFDYFNIKLPLVLISFSVLIFKRNFDTQFTQNVSIAYCIAITTATIASAINYIQNYTELTALVLQSKPIPIMGEIHHITFSVFCAFAILVSAYYAHTKGIKWLWIIAIINLAGLHFLTARTGLAGFYFTCTILGIIYVMNNKIKPAYLVGSIVAILALPIIAYYSLPGFKNRIINSMEDIKVIVNNKDANYQSMGMRIEASKTAFSIFKNNPFVGVGVSNIKQEMKRQYIANESTLYEENRILPHNQFFIEAAIHGIFGLLILILFFLLPFFNRFIQMPSLFISIWALILFACMFECLFDRQHGVILVSLFWFLYYQAPINRRILR